MTSDTLAEHKFGVTDELLRLAGNVAEAILIYVPDYVLPPSMTDAALSQPEAITEPAEFDPFAAGGWQDANRSQASDGAYPFTWGPPETWSPATIDLARFVADNYPEYAWATQYLPDLTPEEREELREERERFLSNPETQRIISA